MGNVADELRHPVGELPPEVYWRRRVVIIVGSLLAVVVLYYLIRGAFAGGGDPEVTPLPSDSGSPSPTASASIDTSTAAAPACTSSSIAVTADAVPFTSSDGSEPYFEVGITNTGSADCTLDLTAPGDELLIDSGSRDSPERYWSNLDCTPQVPLFDDAPRIVKPGEEALVAAQWPVERSIPACDRELATPQAGFYWATVTVLGVQAESTQFQIEN